MGPRKYLKVLVPLALIVIAVASGFGVPATFSSPTVNAVDGTVVLLAEVRYAVFSGGCNYKQTVQEKSLSMDELIGISSNTYNGSKAASEIQAFCKVIVSQVNHYSYYSSLSNEGVDVSIILSEIEYLLSLNGSGLCSLITRYGGSCSQGFPPLLPVFSVSIPLGPTDVNYVISARVELNNQLPLTIEKIGTNESNGIPLSVGFNETSCAENCSFPITLTSACYSASMVQSTSAIRLVLNLSTDMMVVWGFPSWWIRIGTTEKTISATLEVNLSNCTVRLLA